jgi:hypothetical protein
MASAPKRSPGPADRIRQRGQAHTLEAVVAALLLVTSIGFALQMTIVTPLSASTSSQHIENQQRATASGIMTSAAETGALTDTVLYWNDSEGRFHNTTDVGYYTNNPPDTAFGRMLEESFDEESIAYNVNLHFVTPGGEHRETELVYRGVPTENAVSASRTVAIRADDHLVNEDGVATNVTVANATKYFVGQAGGPHQTATYNLVRVEVVVWRI